MIRLFRQYISKRKIIFIIGEAILIFFAVTLATYFFLGRGIGLLGTMGLTWSKGLFITVITELSLYFSDLYEFKKTDTTIDIGSRLIQSIGITSIVLAIIYYLWPGMVIGRWVFFISLVVLLLFLISWRILFSIIMKKRLFAERVIVLGAGELAGDMLREIKRRRDISYNIRYVLDQKKEGEAVQFFEGIPVRYGFDRLYELVENENISDIIVALDQKRGVMPYKELLNCKVRGIDIIDGETFYERITGKLLVEKINPSWLIFSDGFVKSDLSRVIKRLIGLTLSSVMLITLSPFLILVALLIKLDSPGPVLFSQKRVGEVGKIFTLHKFRSMRADAEKESGPVWATEADPRITRVGRIIRKLRIDELPQLWNVFRGEMSFVGPRPERQFFVEKLKKTIPYYNERFSVKPGVTGWAQIMYPYGATEKDALEKLKYDLYYIKNMSIAFDLMVIFHTVKIVLLGRGAR
jgi:sugar transferase (PEP-CTERM system associated)